MALFCSRRRDAKNQNIKCGILRNTFRSGEILATVSKYGSVKYKIRPYFRVSLSFHGTTPPYTILSEICTGLFRVYVIAKSSAVNSQSSSTLRENQNRGWVGDLNIRSGVICPVTGCFVWLISRQTSLTISKRRSAHSN